jgi:murein DD-endopeptidase MepM/ murein hydrolase activator NlpD
MVWGFWCMLGGMPAATFIEVIGNSLAVVFDDGRKFLAHPIPGNRWIMAQQVTTEGETPEPGPPGNPGGGGTVTPGEWQWPFQYSRYVLDIQAAQFGMRVNPVTGVYRLHAGLDFGAGGIAGLDIPCAHAGTVIHAGANGGEGNSVHVDHGAGFTTRYFHMVTGSIAVSNGQSVTKGQKLGNVGTTGNSTGEHLHWETRVNGEPVNPRDFMRERGVPES